MIFLIIGCLPLLVETSRIISIIVVIIVIIFVVIVVAVMIYRRVGSSLSISSDLLAWPDHVRRRSRRSSLPVRGALLD